MGLADIANLAKAQASAATNLADAAKAASSSFVIPGSITSAADTARAAAGSAADGALPSYSSMLSSIQSGAINVDVSAHLGALSAIGVDTSSISSTISSAQASMHTDMAVSNAAIAQAYKSAQAAGTTPSADDLAAATAPLSVLKNAQSLLSSATSSVQSAVSSHASTLGASLTGDPIADTHAVASAVNAFNATVPVAPTAPTPPLASVTVSGVTLPNPSYSSQLSAFNSGPQAAYTAAQGTYNSQMSAFTSVPSNVAGLSAVSAISSAVSSIGSSLSSSFSSLVSTASAGTSSIMSTLKADAMLSSLTKPMPTQLSSIASSNLNLNQISNYTAIKAQEAPQKSVIATSSDPVRPTGRTVASHVADLPPAAVSDKDANRIWSYELKGLSNDQLKYNRQYWAIFGISDPDAVTQDQRTKAMSDWMGNEFTKILGADAATNRTNYIALTTSKTDKTTWTDGEQAIAAQYKKDRETVNASTDYVNMQAATTTAKQYYEWYKLAYDAWIKEASRYSLPADLLTQLSTYKA